MSVEEVGSALTANLGKAPPLVRAVSLRGFQATVTALGGNPDQLVRDVGLPLEALRNEELLIPVMLCASAFEHAAASLRCPDFGMRLSDHQDISGLGSLAIAVRHSSTFRDAFECARRFLALHQHGSTLALVDDPHGSRGVVGLRHVWSLEGGAFRQSMDNALLNMHRVVQTLAGGEYGLRSVELGYRPPAPRERYAVAYGGVRVRSERPMTMLRIASQLLNESIDGADEMLKAVTLEYLRQLPTPPSVPCTTRTRQVVQALLGTGRLDVGRVAEAMAMSVRTLQRRLADEGSSLASIIDQVRRDKATQLLTDGSLRLGDIAILLDFSDQATLTRASRRWWGTTPTQRRQALTFAGA